MAKVLFGRDNVSGNKFYKPGAKNAVHKHWTARTREAVNREVVREFVSFSVAGAIDQSIVPEAHICVVDGKRCFLITEIGGSGCDGASFMAIGRCSQEVIDGIPKTSIGRAYALTAGLLGDRDANSDANVGAVVGADGTPSLFHFDLGHSDPERFTLDERTLLPKNISTGSTGFRLGRINRNRDILTVEMRRDGLVELYGRRKKIFDIIDGLIEQAGDNVAMAKEITMMKASIEARMSYLGRVLTKHIARQSAEADGSSGRRFYAPPIITAM